MPNKNSGGEIMKNVAMLFAMFVVFFGVSIVIRDKPPPKCSGKSVYGHVWACKCIDELPIDVVGGEVNRNTDLFRTPIAEYTLYHRGVGSECGKECRGKRQVSKEEYNFHMRELREKN